MVRTGVILCLAYGAVGSQLRGKHTKSCKKTAHKTRDDSSDAVYADGYSRIACEVDVAPEAERIYFKDEACGKLPSCKLKTLPMEPRICFDFCRGYEKAHFFGLKGTDCYCAGYFKSGSTGGQGTCNFACDGAKKEMCGGADKSSLFEMHMCGDSADEATIAHDLVNEAFAASSGLEAKASLGITKLNALAKDWTPGVCSIEPEGKRICALPGMWLGSAETLQDSMTNVKQQVNVLEDRNKELEDAMAEIAASPDSGKALTAVEKSTRPARDAATSVKGKSTSLNMIINSVAGPFSAETALAGFDKVYTALGDTENDWHAVCALVPIAGASYAAVTDEADAASKCGNRCLAKSSGTKGCVGFNYQYKDGLATCQLLTAEGLTKPKDRMTYAVPIFEVSKTKRDAMGLSKLACYAHGAFLAGHPRGPLKPEVMKEIST